MHATGVPAIDEHFVSVNLLPPGGGASHYIPHWNLTGTLAPSLTVSMTPLCAGKAAGGIGRTGCGWAADMSSSAHVGRTVSLVPIMCVPKLRGVE